MIHQYLLDDASTMTMCADHRRLVADHIQTDLGRQQGGKWKCQVCSIHRRMIGALAEPVSVVVWGKTDDYVVTRYPVMDTSTGQRVVVTYCTCMAWRFQKKPAWERWCKHCSEAADQLPAVLDVEVAG